MTSQMDGDHGHLIELISQLETEKHAQGDAFKAYTELASEQVRANVSVAAGLYSLLTLFGVGLLWWAADAPTLSAPIAAVAVTWVLFNLTRVWSGSRRGHRSRESYKDRISWLL
jgi:hypothetical protein